MENEENKGKMAYVGEMQKSSNMSTTDDGRAEKEQDQMKRRMKEMEEEADALRKMQAKVEKEIGSVQFDPREVADSRSIYIGNVDYACTPEEVQQHFQSCGTVNRVTILTDKFGHPKGFAYLEFDEFEAVEEALLLNKSELRGRQLKVLPKRTNVPGMKQNPPNPYGYGKVPRFRRPGRFSPYN